MLNLKKYKRLITVGCSFTKYIWPTWADILAHTMTDTELINLGKSGAGNPFISYKVAEGNTKLNYTEDDLVVVMWTTFCREDRYVNDHWQTPGNIFTQAYYPENFVKKFCDTKGYILRDLNVVSLTKGLLDSLPCDYIFLTSVPWNYQNEETQDIGKILNVYKPVTSICLPNLFQTEMRGHWDHGHVYDHPQQGIKFQDYHPSPARYYAYLKKVGFDISQETYKYAIQSTKLLKACPTVDDIHHTFNLDANNPPVVMNKEIKIDWF